MTSKLSNLKRWTIIITHSFWGSGIWVLWLRRSCGKGSPKTWLNPGDLLLSTFVWLLAGGLTSLTHWFLHKAALDKASPGAGNKGGERDRYWEMSHSTFYDLAFQPHTITSALFYLLSQPTLNKRGLHNGVNMRKQRSPVAILEAGYHR